VIPNQFLNDFNLKNSKINFTFYSTTSYSDHTIRIVIDKLSQKKKGLAIMANP
tara:strand:- start:347 stop:505 length:159 start_codon:yes stop_codon:yes gene_type:complete